MRTKAKPTTDYTKISPDGEILHNELGQEIPDPNPMQPPLGYKRADPIAVRIREMIIGHKLAEEAARAGKETFAEADDFAVGDDWDAEKSSPYEANFDPMTPEERAALSSKGRDTEKSLTKEEKARLSSRPKKTESSPRPGATPVSEALAKDPANGS